MVRPSTVISHHMLWTTQPERSPNTPVHRHRQSKLHHVSIFDRRPGTPFSDTFVRKKGSPDSRQRFRLANICEQTKGDSTGAIVWCNESEREEGDNERLGLPRQLPRADEASRPGRKASQELSRSWSSCLRECGCSRGVPQRGQLRQWQCPCPKGKSEPHAGSP